MLNIRDARDEVPTPVGVHRDTTGRHATVTVVVATDDDAHAWAAATCATRNAGGDWSITVHLADTGAVCTALDTITYRIRTEYRGDPMNVTTDRLDLPGDDHTSDSVLDAARAAADLVQYLARATTDPHTTSAALGDLVTILNDTARDLEQVLGQASTAALALRTERGVYDDRGPSFDPADTAERVADAVAEARGHLARALPALRDASADASHVGHHVNSDKD